MATLHTWQGVYFGKRDFKVVNISSKFVISNTDFWNASSSFTRFTNSWTLVSELLYKQHKDILNIDVRQKTKFIIPVLSCKRNMYESIRDDGANYTDVHLYNKTEEDPVDFSLHHRITWSFSCALRKIQIKYIKVCSVDILTWEMWSAIRMKSVVWSRESRKMFKSYKHMHCIVDFKMVTIILESAISANNALFSILTFPVRVDRSSPPITLISPVDWSFCKDEKTGELAESPCCHRSWKYKQKLVLVQVEIV